MDQQPTAQRQEDDNENTPKSPEEDNGSPDPGERNYEDIRIGEGEEMETAEL